MRENRERDPFSSKTCPVHLSLREAIGLHRSNQFRLISNRMDEGGPLDL